MIVSKAWLVRSKVATTFDIGNNWYNKMQTAASFFREVNLSSNAVRYTFYLPESEEPPEVPPTLGCYSLLHPERSDLVRGAVGRGQQGRHFQNLTLIYKKVIVAVVGFSGNKL